MYKNKTGASNGCGIYLECLETIKGAVGYNVEWIKDRPRERMDTPRNLYPSRTAPCAKEQKTLETIREGFAGAGLIRDVSIGKTREQSSEDWT
jgi:hypothetical protein